MKKKDSCKPVCRDFGFGLFVCLRGSDYSWLSGPSLLFLQITPKQNVKPRNSMNNNKNQALSVLIDLT